MKASTTIGDLYISINGTNVTVIQTIGDYDNITHRSFDNDRQAIDYYKAQGGVVKE